ncbi:MAG: hypothetical protein KDC79_02130 [Cyclobacteriaceae bacterium]|nr:hypothetical protein [Cyclobacteriaceae bacterium]
MSRNQIFFVRLIALSVILLFAGYGINREGWLELPSIYSYLIGYYFLISVLAFLINLKGTKKESEIAVWYYLSSVMIKFLLAAGSVFLLVRIYDLEKAQIIWTSFVLYPLYEAVVTFDIYNRVR